jgi:tricorn protease
VDLAVGGPALAAHEPSGLCSSPAIDGDLVAFVCDGAIWEAPVEGTGRAHRRTPRAEAIATPLIDQRRGYLAFVAARRGPAQIYLARPRRARCRQLTHLTAHCQLLGWTAAGKIAFSSSGGHAFRQQVSTWTVDPATGEIDRMVEGLLVRPGDGGRAVATPPGVDARSWQDYRGGARGEIWIDPDGSGSFSRVTPNVGNLSSPILCGRRIYFVASEHGPANLFSCDLTGHDLQRHTDHGPFSVHAPASDGRRVVYCAGGDLFVLGPGMDPQRVPIAFTELLRGHRPRLRPLADGLRSLDLDPEQRRLVCCAFGTVQVSSATGWRQASPAGSAACSFTRLLSDGRLLVVLSGPDGDELVVMSRDGTTATRLRPTLDVGRVVAVAVPSLGSLAVVATHRYELLSIALDTGACTPLDRSTCRAIEDLDVSRDGRFCAYGFPVSLRRNVIRVAATDGSGSVIETDPGASDSSPSFTGDGSVVYLSLMPRSGRGSAPMATVQMLPLEEGAPPAEYARGSRPVLRALPIPPGPYARVVGLEHDLVLLVPSAAPPRLERVDQEGRTSLRVIPRAWVVGADSITRSGLNSVLVRQNRTFWIGLSDRGGLRRFEAMPVPAAVLVDARALSRATVEKAWRLVADEVARSTQDHDWRRLLDAYVALADRVCTGRDLLNLVNEMLGHLCSSHAFMAGPVSARPTGGQNSLGVDGRIDRATGGWRIHHVPQVDLQTPPPLGLADPVLETAAGDRLVAVNGAPITSADALAALLVGDGGRTVRCAVEGAAGHREICAELVADDRALRYAAWVQERRALVRSASKGDFDYVHLPDVSSATRAALEDYLWSRDGVRGLVVDLRFNEGGAQGGEIAELLARQPFARMRTRWSDPYELPPASCSRALVVIVNRFTTSGGELLATALRLLTGCVILGEPTFGAGIGHTVPRSLPDGSHLLLPELQLTSPRAFTEIENRGVVPDIVAPGCLALTMPDPVIGLALDHLEGSSRPCGSGS